MSSAAASREQRRLESDLVILEPFDPTRHITPFLQVLKANPDMVRYVTFPAMDGEDDFRRELYDKHYRDSSGPWLYAVLDKAGSTTTSAENGEKKKQDPSTGKYAGIASLEPKRSAASTELGVILFPTFQRTHVSTHTIGLLLQHTLDAPSAGGLGLRRVEWRTHAGNTASRRAAARMGFEFEGITRWERVLPRDAVDVGLPVDALERRNGSAGEGLGRHTANFSVVWDEWEGKRSGVIELMERPR